MTIRFQHIDIEAAKASAREAALARKTCEGCTALRTYPRPMCAGEKSPHFRTVRDTYHERCQVYSVGMGKGEQPAPPTQPPAPEPPKPKRMKLVRVRGSDRVVSADEYDRLQARMRRVSP